MANNKLKIFPLTGGEDAVSSVLQIPDGGARVLYNYEQDYNTGYTRIKGYRPLVSATLPGEGMVRGLITFNNNTYMFRDKTGAAEGGMWRAIPDVWRIGSEADGDSQPLWGTNILVTEGSWAEVVNIYSPRVNTGDITPGPSTTLLPGGYYQFVESNFRATVGEGIGTYIGGHFVTVSEANVTYQWEYGDICTDDGEDGLELVALFAGGNVGDSYICSIRHTRKTSEGNNVIAANWIKVERTVAALSTSHDISADGGLLYGVDGINKSFEFDDTSMTLVQIDTGYDNDAPQHIESQGNRLCVGFRAGELAVSSTISPHDFDAVRGAGSFGVQSLLTGLSAGPDGVLFVFCKEKTYLLKGLSGPLVNADLKKHAKDIGCFPYTQQSVGSNTVFYDNWGITNLQITEAYGDVISNALSNKIQPVLSGNQPVTSSVSRQKAQYKLYFRRVEDPYTTLLLNSVQIVSQESKGLVAFSHNVYPFAVTCADLHEYKGDAAWSFTSQKELHVVGVRELDDLGAETFAVYQLDIGNSFNGKPYLSYMTLPFNFLGSPHKVKKFRKMMVNVNTSTYTDMKYSVDFSYGNKSIPKETGGDIVDPSGARWNTNNWSSFYWGGGHSQYAEAYINGAGENLSVTISSNSATESPHNLLDISFVYQPLRIEH